MSIPDFKSNHDWEEFTQLFDKQWHCKRALLNRVRDDMFPGCHGWSSVQPHTLEVINDIVSNLVYECERQFKETHQDYKTNDDVLIPYRSFKESITEALKEALKSQEEKLS